MKDAYYFPHDANAQHDPKIIQLIERYGYEGYGVYWAVIERLRNESGYSHPIEAIMGLGKAMEWGISESEGYMPNFIDFCLKIGLLNKKNEHIYSESLNRRMLKLQEVREKLQEAGKKGAEARWGSQKGANATPMPVKYSKEKKSISKREPKTRFLDFVLLTPKEHELLVAVFGEAGTKERIENLNSYLGSKGDKYKSHYHTILNWERRDKKTNTDKPQGAWWRQL